MEENQFSIDGMRFEIVESSFGTSNIKILGEDPRIILIDIRGKIPMEHARSMVLGYLEGYERGSRDLQQAVNKGAEMLDINREAKKEMRLRRLRGNHKNGPAFLQGSLFYASPRPSR